MNKYVLSTLVVEVTRKCNMSCAHCLRGEAQNIDIDLSYIDKLLENVSEIRDIVFSGGEPSLNVKAISHTLSLCKEKEIPISCFFIATNGKENIKELSLACLDWYVYCDEKEYCSLALSVDDFHDYIEKVNENYLRAFSFFSKDKMIDYNNIPLLQQGRAKELNGYKKRELIDSGLCIDGNDIDMIYLSANGEIRVDCDVAYDNLDYTIGNLNYEEFEKIIESNR